LKKILFHSHQLNYRGTTNALVDYAEYNESILGNESIIIYDGNFKEKGLDIYSQEEVVENLKKRFKVITYETKDKMVGDEVVQDYSNLYDIAEKYDLFYTLKAGNKAEPLVPTTKTANHVVFQYIEPHGDRYAYVSKWLSESLTKGEIPYVPHIVDMPDPDPNYRSNFRALHNIPQDAVVFGRHGGFYTFDIQHTAQAIVNIVNKYNNIYFVMANTRQFAAVPHPQIVHVNPFFGNQQKANYISVCDAMIHGRVLGESFGNSIAEFLFQNKPVLASIDGYDKNHIELLKGYDLIYDIHTVEARIINLAIKILNKDKTNYKKAVSEFTPKNVMAKFEEVFIK
jgi:hypothetical protein